MECGNEGKLDCRECFVTAVAADVDVRMSKDRDLTLDEAKALAEADSLDAQLEQPSVLKMGHTQRIHRATQIGRAAARGEDYRDY